MKKILLTLAILINVCLNAQAQNTARVFLSHEGKATMFTGAETKIAMEAAVDGDTIYLGEGNFSPFNITKKVTVIGAGAEKTYISGGIDIAIPDSVTLEATLIAGVKTKNDITVSLPVNRLKIRKCRIDGSLVMNKSVMVSDVLITNCSMGNLYTYDKFNQRINVVNSYIGYQRNSALKVVFLNCNIYRLAQDESFYGTLINCIIGGRNHGFVVPSSATNSIFYSNANTGEMVLYNSKTDVYDPLNISREKLQELGYLGTDGTIVGWLGGPEPFTYDLFAPKVEEPTLKVSEDNKTLEVETTITPY